MKKVLFSLGVLGLFANADAMQPDQQGHACSFPKRDPLSVETIRTVEACIDIKYAHKKVYITGNKVAVHYNPHGNRPTYSHITEDTLIYDEDDYEIESDNSYYGYYCNNGTLYISNAVTELPDGCFANHPNIRIVVFGPGFPLERLGVGLFTGTNLEAVSIPDSVLELGYGCFKECKSLRQVTFGQGSKLELIGVDAFCDTPLEEVSIPDSVKELGDGCFDRCIHLRRVTFGPMSALEHIGHFAFSWTFIEEISIPDSVRKLEDNCFFGCIRLKHVGFNAASQLEYIGGAAFTNALLRGAAIESVAIPDSVRELGYACFSDCPNLRCVSFGPNSQLELIGGKVFCNTQLEEIHIPGSVRELGESCFKNCTSLKHVAFSANSCLTWIGEDAFIDSPVEIIEAPQHLQEMLKQHCPDAELVLVN